MKLLLATALTLSLPGVALAQQASAPSTTSSASTPTTGDVSASTSGTATGTEDGVAVGGTADAGAANGGTAQTSANAKLNNNVATQNSTATASDADERARSRTHSKASTKGADVSNSTSMYKKDGEKPVVTHDHDVTTPKEKAAASEPGATP